MGYGLNDPNVKEVWRRVQEHSTRGCEPVGFCILIQENEAEIERVHSWAWHRARGRAGCGPRKPARTLGMAT